ncbi:CS1 type fimbrial major subunit [Pseudomonas guariconensis]|uniref:CS1 type fimbrial major subunit n=1 Tax=Pseudomonas guariconensis TaxID=1288410 RepID=UPI0018A8E7E7|nr:CS1 type fimbrial major subunit [Pseudomonas guariconensis]MBF8723384.1 adhesin [Pseudomonas guariconensis]MBF8795294.1 adhesin [Pseudomonas monteilii]
MNARFLAVPLLALIAGTAVAEQVQQQVQVTAQIPTDQFYVRPVGSWIGYPQALQWNAALQEFGAIRKQFEAKSSLGPIKGYLFDVAEVSDAATGNKFGLKITMHGKELKTTATELLTAAQAGAGAVMDFQIAAVKPSGGYKVGTYNGFVNMVFESAAPSGS